MAASSCRSQAEDAGLFLGLGVECARRLALQIPDRTAARLCPDPASRFQPDGPHGSSEVVDAAALPMDRPELARRRAPASGDLRDAHRHVHPARHLVAARSTELPHLAETGVTVLEVMPVAEFPGRFGWGYDGVQWFAPAHIYGSPDDFRRFVDRAHSLGPRRDPGRGLQSSRPGRQLHRKIRSAILLREDHGLGQGHQLRRRRLRPGPRIRASRMPATGSTSSIWTACGWMPRRTSTTAPKITSCAPWRAKFANAPRRAR